jgi:4-carboxymuconolactone decarboxylase
MFPGSSDSVREEILKEKEELFGCVPPILRIMGERTEFFVFSSLKDFNALRPESLDAWTAELVTIAAAAEAGAEKCIKVHINAARRAGATRGEILDVIFIAAAIGQTKVLAPSLRIFHEIFEGRGI